MHQPEIRAILGTCLFSRCLPWRRRRRYDTIRLLSELSPSVIIEAAQNEKDSRLQPDSDIVTFFVVELLDAMARLGLDLDSRHELAVQNLTDDVPAKSARTTSGPRIQVSRCRVAIFVLSCTYLHVCFKLATVLCLRIRKPA